MTKGLVTRIGEWMDRKWEASATVSEVLEGDKRVAANASAQMDAIDLRINGVDQNLIKFQAAALSAIATLESKLDATSEDAKELPDMKTRFEKLELYLGMSRKVDPTKPAVAKSAFAMWG